MLHSEYLILSKGNSNRLAKKSYKNVKGAILADNLHKRVIK